MAKRLVLVLVALVVLPATAYAATVKVRIEGKTQTLWAPTEVTVNASNALDALEQASLAGEFYYHVTQSGFGQYVDQVGRYGATADSGWVFKVNDASPPVGADKVALKDNDRVLWYYADVRAGRRTAHAVAEAVDQGRLLPGNRAGRQRARGPVNGLVFHIGSKRTIKASTERRCLPRAASRRAGPGDRHRRGSIERREVRSAVVLLLVLVVAGCGGVREHGTATLWVTQRSRCSRPLHGHGPRRSDRDAGARAEAQGDDSIRRQVRSVDRRSRRIVDGSARLVLLRERDRRRPQCRRGEAT